MSKDQEKEKRGKGEEALGIVRKHITHEDSDEIKDHTNSGRIRVN
jgi:hypothetical protein